MKKFTIIFILTFFTLFIFAQDDDNTANNDESTLENTLADEDINTTKEDANDDLIGNTENNDLENSDQEEINDDEKQKEHKPFDNKYLDRVGLYIGGSIAIGGRYDEVRACVASPAGSLGGPAMEFTGFVLEYMFIPHFGVGVYIPLFRPILFGAAFSMLQFIPEVTIPVRFNLHPMVDLALTAGIGVSFHYGPDYTSGNPLLGEESNPSFFAVGPRISFMAGPSFHLKKNLNLIVGLKPYIEYLFSDELSGMVIGGEIDVQLRYHFNFDK